MYNRLGGLRSWILNFLFLLVRTRVQAPLEEGGGERLLPWLVLLALPRRSVISLFNVPKDKVAIISGGGSGHEPSHAGFVGAGLLSAAVCGNTFACESLSSPTRSRRIFLEIDRVFRFLRAWLSSAQYKPDQAGTRARRQRQGNAYRHQCILYSISLISFTRRLRF